MSESSRVEAAHARVCSPAGRKSDECPTALRARVEIHTNRSHKAASALFSAANRLSTTTASVSVLLCKSGDCIDCCRERLQQGTWGGGWTSDTRSAGA